MKTEDTRNQIPPLAMPVTSECSKSLFIKAAFGMRNITVKLVGGVVMCFWTDAEDREEKYLKRAKMKYH
jgi:hypothetical protein